MLEIPHVLTGIGIAANVSNPYVSIPLSFLSHFALDKIPHWNPHFYTESKSFGKPKKESTVIAIADSVSALAIGLGFTFNALPDTALAANIFLCSFASVLSDQVKIPFFYMGVRTGFMKKWVDFERSIQVDTKLFWGIVNQVLVSLAAIFWILK